MQYAERLPYLPSPKSLAVPLVALVLGAAAATGLYTLIDDDWTSVTPADTRVIVVDPPAQPGPGVAAKNEAGVASAIGQPSQPQTLSKDEAATASAIGTGTYASPETKDEAATAAAIAPSKSSTAQTQDEANRTDPHGPAAALP
jgi:hypothetical protein